MKTFREVDFWANCPQDKQISFVISSPVSPYENGTNEMRIQILWTVEKLWPVKTYANFGKILIHWSY